MQSRMDEFKTFVSNHTKIREEVRNGKRTWQNIYEEWVLYGDTDPQWEKYQNDTSQKVVSQNGNNLSINMDSLKHVVSYIKKINPDDLNKTLNTVQKVIQIAQTVGGGKASSIAPIVSSAYNDWWD